MATIFSLLVSRGIIGDRDMIRSSWPSTDSLCGNGGFNLFSGLIPQQGLARINRDRQRQSMVPDFRIALPWEGRPRPVLHELKVISCSKSRYKPTMDDRAVNKRAGQLHREYQEKAKKTDRDFGGVEEG